jgi:sulfur-carrier protein
VQISLFFFAALRDQRGQAEESFVTASKDVGSLRLELMTLHPQLTLDGVRIAINEEFVTSEHALREGDVVALIPPVSGG